MAIGFQSNICITSTNGQTWSRTSATLPDSAAYVDIAYGNGTWVALARTPLSLLLFLPITAIAGQTVHCMTRSGPQITYADGKFVACNGGGTTNNVAYSTDGLTWTGITVGTNSWQSVAYGNGYYVLVGQGGARKVAYSTDLITWTEVEPANYNTWIAVAAGDGEFVALSSDGGGQVMVLR